MPEYRALPAKGSDERKALAARAYELTANHDYREICRLLNIGSTATIARLKNEALEPATFTAELRDEELARLDTWNERLETAAELVLGSDKPEKMAELAASAAKISAERRRLHAIDVPVTTNVNLNHTTAENPHEDSKLARWAEEWQTGDLAKRDEYESRRHEDTR